jgi:hypothetical protein
VHVTVKEETEVKVEALKYSNPMTPPIGIGLVVFIVN